VTSYKTLYEDLGGELVSGWPITISAVVFIALIFVTIVVRFFELPKNYRRVPFYVGSISFGCLLIVIAMNLSRKQTNYLLDLINTEDLMVVEGVVSDFKKYNNRESFVLNGVFFQYSEYRNTIGFNIRSIHGGPIKPKKRLRISYANYRRRNYILKIEEVYPNKALQGDR